MDLQGSKHRKALISNIFKYDLPAGVVVYLVALPLCLGIALASGAPLISGVVAGIAGGLVVSIVSRSPLSVSGPAAGLTIIVLDSIKDLGSFDAFLLAVFMAGVMQLAFGFLKAGFVANYFPSSVIKGMLAAIGVILILKQIPHAIGYDIDYIGDFNFLQWDHENTFTELVKAFSRFIPGAIVVSVLSIIIMIVWPKIVPKQFKFVPGALIAVVVSVTLNQLFHSSFPELFITEEHRVSIPIISDYSDFLNTIATPDFTRWQDPKIYLVAGTLALVASLETLLSVSAIDKLDPFKRSTPANRELKAQGVGNMISSLFGGLPLTAVIVRGSANAGAGARTRFSTMFHGIFLLVSLFLFPELINQIPYACLAAVLIVVGYKLTNISLYKSLYHQGWEQFVPFVLTILAIVFTDLLKGIGIGMAVSALFILRRNLQNPFKYENKDDDSGNTIRIALSEEVSFLAKAGIVETLNKLPNNCRLIVDASKSRYIDDDIVEVIEEFKERAILKNITIELIGFNQAYEIFNHRKEENYVQKDYEQLFINNRKWVAQMLEKDKDYFKKLAEGQFPKYLFIGCSDSRVPSNEITGTDPGEMFVHRNIANLVVHTDMNLMSVLHYSVEVLKVEHVIVCGHYGCGGVKAAVDNHDHGLIDKWLMNIKDVYRLYYDELESIKNPDERHRRLVELNVIEQVYHLSMTPVVQRAWERGQKLQVHGWVYDIHEGLLRDLEIGIDKDKKWFDIYQYQKENFKLIQQKK